MSDLSERHAPNLTLRGSLGTMLAKMRHSCQSILLAGVLMLAGGSVALAESPASHEHMLLTGRVLDVSDEVFVGGYCTDPQVIYDMLVAARDNGRRGFQTVQSAAIASDVCLALPQEVPVSVTAFLSRVTVQENTHSILLIQFVWSGVEYYSYVVDKLVDGKNI